MTPDLGGMTPDLELGNGHTLTFISWAPDDLPGNREQFGVPLPCVEKAGALIAHPRPDGSGDCLGHVHFDVPGIRSVAGFGPLWQVESWEPLTISPSVLCKLCGDHGFIRGGKWVTA